MLVELGPVAPAEVQGWSRFARRLITELRTDPHELQGIATDDLLCQWSTLIDQWAAVAGEAPVDGSFRWSQPIDCEEAEFLVHGLERCLHSATIGSLVTAEEAERYSPFTLHVIQAFLDGLVAEGTAHEHLADQIRALFGSALS